MCCHCWAVANISPLPPAEPSSKTLRDPSPLVRWGGQAPLQCGHLLGPLTGAGRINCRTCRPGQACAGQPQCTNTRCCKHAAGSASRSSSHLLGVRIRLSPCLCWPRSGLAGQALPGPGNRLPRRMRVRPRRERLSPDYAWLIGLRQQSTILPMRRHSRPCLGRARRRQGAAIKALSATRCGTLVCPEE